MDIRNNSGSRVGYIDENTIKNISGVRACYVDSSGDTTLAAGYALIKLL
jgi:hypothetical protein